MPNAPKTPIHTVRIDDELWATFGTAAETYGADRSYLLREFIRWFVRERGARLPARPT